MESGALTTFLVLKCLSNTFNCSRTDLLRLAVVNGKPWPARKRGATRTYGLRGEKRPRRLPVAACYCVETKRLVELECQATQIARERFIGGAR